MICKFCSTEQTDPCRGTQEALDCPVTNAKERANRAQASHDGSKPESMVVKVQKVARLVVTSKDGKAIMEMAWPPDFDEKMGGKQQIYMTAGLDEEGFVSSLEQVVEDQDW